MSESIISKQCSCCKINKPITEFPHSKNTKDGYHNQCKHCHNEQVRRYAHTERGKASFRKRRKKYEKTKKGRRQLKKSKRKYTISPKGKASFRRYRKSPNGLAIERRYYYSKKIRAPQKLKARNAVQLAVKAGKLPKANTHICHCGKQAEEYHHHLGYEPEHWLDVVPVCVHCHLLIHNLINK